jgi:hypothetical protein
MKLPAYSLIDQEKLTRYLLVRRKHGDKSKWLSRAGYTINNWKVLENDLRRQILTLDAVPTDQTRYGQMYEIRGNLTGPNDKTLATITIWMKEFTTGITKFITMYPDKGK